MEIVNVEKVLDDIQDAPLILTPLDALDPRRELYSAMVLQPQGCLEGNTDRVGHSDQAAGALMCSSYLQEAQKAEADIVVAPEYCVPWSVIEDIIGGRFRPREGALWALGCESIKPKDLRNLAQKTQKSHETVRLIHEQFDAKQEAQKSYIDPLVYVFWCKDSAEKAVLCFLVQFKTTPCRDEGHIELKSLYLGNKVYKFNEGINNISLLSIICSDAFDFRNELVEQHHRNSLILHIQLNQKPGHQDYTSYRTHLFSVGSRSNTEVLCVNWARGVKWKEENGEEHDWRDIGGSAWYLPLPKFNATDQDIDACHKQGLYHSFIGKHWHGFFLNYSPHLALIRKQKVFSAERQALVQPIAPEVLARLRWDIAASEWVTEAPDDGFIKAVNDYADLLGPLPPLCQASPLAVERALELLEGPDGNMVSWYKASELQALTVDSEESIRRVTVHQESDLRRAGVKFRRRRLRHAQTAISLTRQSVPWPPAVLDLAQGFRFTWLRTEPHRNVESLHGAGLATLVYLGEDPEMYLIETIYAKISKALIGEKFQRIFAREPDPLKAAEQADHARDRLCVVFKRDNRIEIFRPSTYASITHPGGTSPVNIAGVFE
ncbi:hypothetical protein [Geomonas oryzae]|uniref:hypothetical protein n=1 Tax=Geomonas oryzae TaxID=2364273 RepID=UPI00100A85AD|nr:hypothetical protein [Geomonas oryzae]